jgi:hypothetical protein
MPTETFISTRQFLGYTPSSTLEETILNKCKEVGSRYRLSGVNPRYYFYTQTFLQQYFQDKVGIPQ